jgi:hypothetical protein
MKLDRAYVELRRGCLYVYLDRGWPPEMPPIVKACHRRVNELFEFFREYGLGQVGVGVVEMPVSCVHAAAALAVMLYAADFDKRVAYELCEDTPNVVKTLIADAARWSRTCCGEPAVDPQYYRKLAAALKELVEAWQDSKKSPTLDEYA